MSQITPSQAPSIDAAATFPVAAVARRLGVAAATLRTWDRRYGLGPSVHEAGCHRRYTLSDLARLETMRRMVNAGVPPAQAAKLASDASNAAIAQVAEVPHDLVEQADAVDSLMTPNAPALARGLSRAALSLDSLACRAAVDQQLNTHGVLWTWEKIIAPVLVALGKRWELTNKTIEVEHLLSEVTVAALGAYADRCTDPRNSRPVLLVCAPEELHSLPLYAIAAGLSEHQVSCRILGARVPHQALVSAMQRIGPSAVMVWSQTYGVVDTTRLAGLPFQRPAAKIFAGGPGWAPILPNDVTRISSLKEAIDLLRASAMA